VPNKLFKLEGLIPHSRTESYAASTAAAAKQRVSTKTQMACDAITTMRSDDPGAKCIVFSSYTRYLDILERQLRDHGDPHRAVVESLR